VLWSTHRQGAAVCGPMSIVWRNGRKPSGRITNEERLAAEQCARVQIERQLTDGCWAVQDRKALNLFAGRAWRFVSSSWPRVTGHADYLLHVDQKAAGVIEAKP
jgi:type I restriction enzyme, R subunit